MSFVPYQIIFDGSKWYAFYNEPVDKALQKAIRE